MFCKNCGKEINDGMAFCPYCGTAVKKHQQVEPAADTAPEAKPEATPTEKDIKKAEAKNTNVFALVGFVLSICTWVIFSFLNYRVYICTVIGAISLTMSVVGLVFAEKKNHNLKSLAIAGLIVSVVAVLFWPLTVL